MDKLNCEISWNRKVNPSNVDKPSTVLNKPFMIGRFDLSPLNSGLGTNFRSTVLICFFFNIDFLLFYGIIIHIRGV